MPVKNREYAYYNKYDELVVTGTLDEIAAELGIKPDTVYFYKSKAYRNRTKRGIRVVELDDEPYFVNVDLDKLQKKEEEFEYKHREMAEVLGISEPTFSNKFIGKHRFTKGEAQELEDLFFLDEGTLIKGEV